MSVSLLPVDQFGKFLCLSDREFPEFFKTHPTFIFRSHLSASKNKKQNRRIYFSGIVCADWGEALDRGFAQVPSPRHVLEVIAIAIAVAPVHARHCQWAVCHQAGTTSTRSASTTRAWTSAERLDYSYLCWHQPHQGEEIWHTVSAAQGIIGAATKI